MSEWLGGDRSTTACLLSHLSLGSTVTVSAGVWQLAYL